MGTATASSKAAANAAPKPGPRSHLGGKGLFRYAPEALSPDILNTLSIGLLLLRYTGLVLLRP
jgi:hypothetical protein